MERKNKTMGENKSNNNKVENTSESFVIRQMKLIKFNLMNQSIEDCRKNITNDERTLDIQITHCKDLSNLDGIDTKNKMLDEKVLKQIKASTCNGLEKETCTTLCAKFVGMKGVDVHSLEDSDRKVQESLDTFIRQTMGHEAYMSLSSRSGDKPLQRIIEHQQAMDKCVKSLKVDISIRDGSNNNTHLEPHQINIERDPLGAKARRSIVDQNLQTIKNNVPLTVAALAAAAAKNPDLPGWPLLSPLKVQLQKCEKCACEFFSPLNHGRHTRTYHRRINYIDKEDLTLKRKNVATFWDKLNHDKAQQIFENSKKYDVEDLLGEAIICKLIAFKGQSNPTILPPTHMKAGQELLDILDKKQGDLLLSSDKILSILDEASEKTFLCSQGEVNKIGLEEKNLVASLGYIVERTLVKAWMIDKDVEALRNQQELFKEEEAAQMKRVKNVARKKKKKEKSRQKGIKERKVDSIQLNLTDENESIDGENLSLDVANEDNSPTTSSTSMTSFGLENQLLEPLEMEANVLIQNISWEDQNICKDEGHVQKLKDINRVLVTSKDVALDHIDEDRMQLATNFTISNGNGKDGYSKYLSINQGTEEDQGEHVHVVEEDQSLLEFGRCTPWKPYKEPIMLDYQDSHQKDGWIPNPHFQDGIQQNTYKILPNPLVGTLYTSNIERSTSPLPGFYHGKPTNLRATTPFLATQQWTKKAQIPNKIQYIKDGQDDKDFQECTEEKGNIKNANVEHATLVCETNANRIVSIEKEKKEHEVKNFKNNEYLHVAIPLAKVVANTGGLSTMEETPFNLNVNLEDWPPLSNSNASFYSKNSRRHPLTSYQCESNAGQGNKFNIDKGIDHQVGLESKVENSNHAILPSTRGRVNYTTSGSIIAGRQKGILIGSVSVPLGDYIHQSKSKIGGAGRSLQVHQSYTSILAPPPIQDNQDLMTRQQSGHENANFQESSTIQVIGSIESPRQYRTSTLRSTSFMNFNGRHERGPTFERTYIYPLGDRGILSKQPPWSNGQIRHIPQKIWRPIKPTIENVDHIVECKVGIEGSIINENDKVYKSTPFIELERPLVSTNENLSQSDSVQVWDMDMNKAKYCSMITTNTKTHLEDRTDAVDLKNVDKNQTSNVQYSSKSTSLEMQQLQYDTNSSQMVSTMLKDDTKNDRETTKCNASLQEPSYVFQNKINSSQSIVEKAYTEVTFTNSIWIDEVVEFHLNRWHLAMKDPETIVSNCNLDHRELQTSVWLDFIDSQTIVCKIDYQNRRHLKSNI